MTQSNLLMSMAVEAPMSCDGCGGPIVETDIGWMHVGPNGVPSLGWLCPMPYMQLARVRLGGSVERPWPTQAPPRKPADQPAAQQA